MAEGSAKNSLDIDINEIIAKLIRENIEKLFSKAVSFAKDKHKKVLIDIGKGFERYLKKSYEKYSKIKTLIYRNDPRHIYDFFEPNDLVFKGACVNSRNVGEILKISNYLIIEGTGGIGKSMLMKHFFIDSLIKGDKIPVFIELRDINNFEGALIDYIWHSMSLLGFNYEKEYFFYALASGRFIFLFDGFDEVNTSKNHDVFKQIDDMCDHYDQNHYIVSSRPIPSRFIDFQRFSILEAQRLTKKQAIDMTKKLEYDATLKSRFIKELEGGLFERHESFASNPLLLNIMLLTYDHYSEIPEKLHTFYQQAFETLYLKHDATKSGYKREMKAKLTMNQFSKVFARFCFQTFLEGKISFSPDELHCTMNEVAKHFDKVVAEDFISDLEDSVCLMRREGLDYRFTHRSFQEFFAACFIKELRDDQQKMVCIKLIAGRYNTRFSPDSVLNMLYDMSEKRFEQNVILPTLQELHDPEATPDEQFLKHFDYFAEGIEISNESVQMENGDVQFLATDEYGMNVYLKEDLVFFMIEHAINLRKFEQPTGKAVPIEAIDAIRKNVLPFVEKEVVLNGRVSPRSTGSEMCFSTKEIGEYPILLDCARTSFVGETINAAMRLRIVLEEERVSSTKEIHDMLGLL